MIKFFRKIRQNLLSEGKTGKYLKYAIGEIILVVIGILIALGINNWNNNRLVDYQKINLLKNIKEDLISDTLAFEKSIKLYEELITKKKKLISLSEYGTISSDSLSYIFFSKYSNYDINVTTFTKVTNLGISELSLNDSLSNKIYKYYTNELKSFKTYIDWEIEETNNESNYWTSQNEFEFKSEFPKFRDSVTNRQNLIKLIIQPRGRNQILNDYYRKKRVLDKYQEMDKIASDLIIEIQIDLNNG
jgi:hypothetical protein